MVAAKGRPGSFGRWAWAAGLLVLLLAMITYAGVLACGLFIWDDRDLLDAAAGVLEGTASIWSGHLGNYHPLTMASLAVDQWIGNGDLRFPHATNILLHALNALLVFLLSRKVLRHDGWALLAALLFALHPVHVESVAWIAERKNVLYTFFFLAACWRYVRFLESGSRWVMAQVVLLFVASMFSKAQAVTLPIFLFGLAVHLEGWSAWRKRAGQLAPLLVLSVACGVLAVQAQQADAYLHPERDPGVGRQMVIAATAFVQYPLRVLFPADLSIIHPLPATLGILHFAALFVVAGSVVWWIRSVRSGHRTFPALFVMYAASVVLIVQLVPIGSMLTADRYAYIASIPVCWGLLLGIRRLAVRLTIPAWAVHLPLIAAIIVCAAMTHARVRMWCTPGLLLEEAVQQHPDDPIARFNLAGQLIREKRTAEARSHLEHALEKVPVTVEAMIGLGQVELIEGRPAQALVVLDRAIALAPDHRTAYIAYLNRALACKALNEPAKAIHDLRKVIAQRPTYAKAHYELGVCAAMLGDHAHALEAYRHARALRSEDPTLDMNMAISLGWLGDHRAAVAELDRYLTAVPGSPEGHFLRGVARHRSGHDGCPDLRTAFERGHPMAAAALSELCP